MRAPSAASAITGHELDRRDRAERQPVDRRVEARVHDREHGAPGDQELAARAVLGGEGAPRPAPRRLGYSFGVVIRIRPNPRQLADVAALARDTPEVIECHRVTGEDCYVMTAYVRDVEHLETVIDEFAAYGQTTSAIMQSAPVPRRGLSLER